MNRGGWGERGRDYYSVRGADGCRVLVPARFRHAAARGVMAFATGVPWGGRVRTEALGMAVAAGLGAMVGQGRARLGPPGLEEMLAGVVGREVVLAVRVGTGKPVALLLTPQGGTLGYAKFAVDERTARLVRAEADVLRSLRDAVLPDVTVPRLIHAGAWAGWPFLVQEPLPVGEQTDPPTRHRLLRATAQIANTRGIAVQPLRASDYLHRLTRAVKELDPDPRSEVLRTQLARLPDVTLPFGAAHGDLTRWNMASTQRRDFVWDWERAEWCAPLGFDPLHYDLHERLRMDARAGADFWLRSGARLLRDPMLRRVGLPDTDGAVATVMALYLTERGVRLLREEPASQPDPWLTPLLAHLVSRAGAA